MKIRIIVMSRFLLLDPEIFGPYISKQSEIIRIDQLHHVQIKSEYQKNTIVLQVTPARAPHSDTDGDTDRERQRERDRQTDAYTHTDTH
eukprot:1721607-Rhodomonas_salina.1